MISRNSKATLLKDGIKNLRIEPHFGAVKGIANAFKPESALLLGSGPRTARFLHANIDRLMVVDFEQHRFDRNLSVLPSKAEFYPKAFPVYDDGIIDGKEGLDLSDLYNRIRNFFKSSDLLVIDQDPSIALGALRYFAEYNDVVILRGIDPSSVFNNNFKKYRMSMRYAESSSILVKNHIPVSYNAIRDIVYNGAAQFYREIGIEPSFKFAEA